MIQKAFIQENGNRRMESEMRDVYEELQKRQISTELFTEKRLIKRQLPITKDTLIVAYVPVFLAALRQLGIEPPPPNDYPTALAPYLHRRTWKSTIRQLTSNIFDSTGAVFAKPEGRKKRFTGTVFASPDDLVYLEGASKSTLLLCSEVVEWQSEYRVFVIRGKIIGINHYSGDPAIKLDDNVVAQAVHLFEQSSERTAAYGVDFGVMEAGQTAPVEWNDGFSLGSYGLDKALYTDLLIARWCELTGC